MITTDYKPLILAPAGNRASFLAALSAGADAIYCGMKSFSARMEAKNFSVKELCLLTQLAHDKGTKVYIALNSLIKPDELDDVKRVLDQLNRFVKPDALIIQDLSVIQLARQIGFSGELHLSTLANLSFPLALNLLRNIKEIKNAVIPRELSIDEIKAMAQACPEGIGLEVFVHGALCYGVSGRCYWSSYLGGKSGLRGRCVQPCRRLYTQTLGREKYGKPYFQSRDSSQSRVLSSQSKALGSSAFYKGGDAKKFFSCQDLSLDVLVKVLRTIPQIKAWKIEGRKKGPHYVYYTVKAYQMLRDEGNDAQIRKTAVSLLEQALGRPGTHYHFLSQRPQNPVDIEKQTGSGLLLGRLKGSKTGLFITPITELLPGDILRIGYEDESWHSIYKVTKYVPKKGQYHLKFSAQKYPPKNAPVFLTDRREKELDEMLFQLEQEIKRLPEPEIEASDLRAKLPSPFQPEYREQARKGFKPRFQGRFQEQDKRGFNPRFRKEVWRRNEREESSSVIELDITRGFIRERSRREQGIWLSLDATQQGKRFNFSNTTWWCLPPVMWADDEKEWKKLIVSILKKGGRNFVLNAPWQMALFRNSRGLNLWAGPFCNIANPLAISTMKEIGFSGIIVSPELGKDDYLQLPKHSPLPLGILISGNFPLSVSRIISEHLKTDTPFTSPKGEQAWVRKYGNDVWVYPDWQLDIMNKKNMLRKAGYSLFIHLMEPLPRNINLKKRPGLWNWDVGLL